MVKCLYAISSILGDSYYTVILRVIQSANREAHLCAHEILFACILVLLLSNSLNTPSMYVLLQPPLFPDFNFLCASSLMPPFALGNIPVQGQADYWDDAATDDAEEESVVYL